MSLKKWFGTTLLFSATESGTLVAGDRVRFTDVLYGPTALCYSSQPPRGAFGTSNFNSTSLNRAGWVVNQSTVANQRGGIGKLTIEWEAGGSSATMALPAGECRIEPQELYPRIEKNKYFQGTTPLLPVNVKIAYNAANLVTPDGAAPVNDVFYIALFGRAAIAANPTAQPPTPALPAIDPAITDATQLALARALYTKLLRGEETYYLAGWRYTSIIYSYTLPTINIGAVLQSPNGIGPITIADSTIGWLRLADLVEPAGVNGSMWKITRTWLGGPNGHWDADLYA